MKLSIAAYALVLSTSWLLGGDLNGSVAAGAEETASLAARLYQEGSALERAGNYSGALAKYEAGRQAAEAQRDRATLARNLLGVGSVKRLLGDTQGAMEMLRAARRLGAQQQDKAVWARMLVQVGDLQETRGQYKKAKKSYQQALKIGTDAKDPTERVRALMGLGNLCRKQADYPGAVEYYHKALAVEKELGDQRGVAQTLASLGNTYWSQALYKEAAESFQRALRIREILGDKSGMAALLNNLGASYAYQGLKTEAVTYYQRALTIREALDEKAGIAQTLNNLGIVYGEQSLYAQALACYQRALKISQELGDRSAIAAAINHIGNVYWNQGLNAQAVRFFQSALQMWEALGDRRRIAVALNNLGNVYKNQALYVRALEHYQRALAVWKSVGDKSNIASVLNNMGVACANQGRYDQALEYGQEALRISHAIDTKSITGFVLNSLGATYLTLQDYPRVIKSSERALALGEAIKQPRVIWEARYNLARTHEKLGHAQSALRHYKLAIDEIERVRTSAHSSEGREGFMTEQREVYKSLIGFLYALHVETPTEGYGQQAFYYAEKSRARALLDMLAESRMAVQASIARELWTREREVLQHISQIQARLVNEKDEQKRSAIYKELELEESRYEDLKTEIRRDNPRYAQFNYPEVYSLNQVQKKLLKEDSLLLEYVLSEESSYLCVVGRRQFQIYKLPKKAEIDKAVKAYLDFLKQTPATANDQGPWLSSRLYDLLLRPAESKLDGKRRLILVPDGILCYLPFEAIRNERGPLRSGPARMAPASRYLIEDYEVSYVPSATILGLLAKQQASADAPRMLLAFGDPIYSRLETEPTPANAARGIYDALGFKFPRLRFSGEEVHRIGKLFPQDSISVFTREEALEERVKTEAVRDYKILHFAAHSLLDEDRPMRSAIVLSLVGNKEEDGFLQVREILGLQLNAELVVLSACQTEGGTIAQGEGLLGLTRSFMYAGASSVIASLWSVSDSSTADFMARFYYYLKVRGQSKTEALRNAKLDMLGDESYKHPYYWAAFLLIGEPDHSVFTYKPFKAKALLYGLVFLAAVIMIELTLRRRSASGRTP